MYWCTCFGSTYTKIGTIQRRLAWPLRKDDTQNREAFHIFCDRNSLANPLCFGRRDWNLRLLSKMEKTRHFTTSMSSQRSRPRNESRRGKAIFFYLDGFIHDSKCIVQY
jgi:hypothetical protein